jgi:hypothetical protein
MAAWQAKDKPKPKETMGQKEFAYYGLGTTMSPVARLLALIQLE